jgi:hypothetical protein
VIYVSFCNHIQQFSISPELVYHYVLYRYLEQYYVGELVDNETPVFPEMGYVGILSASETSKDMHYNICTYSLI